MSQFFHTTLVLSQAAFRDLLRERILYNIFFVSLLLLVLGYMAALLVYGHQERVMLHFGTMINALSVYAVAAGAGARVLKNEIEQRTCYLPLSRPVSRVSYYYGKWIGISAFTLLNLILLAAILSIGLSVTGGKVTPAYFQSFFLIWTEALMIAALAQFISLFLRPGLTLMVCLAYFFIAHNHEQMDFLIKQNAGASHLFSFLNHLTPNAQVLLMDTRVYYDLSLSPSELFQRAAYGLVWTALFLVLGNAVFYRKNL